MNRDDPPQLPTDRPEHRFPDGFTLRDEANAIVACAFRNGPLENLHAGKYSELLENEDLSRITDAEMKVLMIAACEKVAELLQLKETDFDRYVAFITKFHRTYCKRWER